jgi:hypothetical protein
MGQADQFAKRVFEEETEASTQGCAHWLGPMEVPSSHVVVIGFAVSYLTSCFYNGKFVTAAHKFRITCMCACS